MNLKPEAKISTLTEAFVNQEILFDGSQSFDKNQDPLDFFWDFGDGNSDQGQKIAHSFKNPGEYLISLIVFDGMASSSVTTTIKILPLTLLRGQVAVKKEPEKPLLPREDEKPEIQKEIFPPPKIVKMPEVEKPEVKESKIISLPGIQEKELPLLASLIEVFKEKSHLLYGLSLSFFIFSIFFIWKIKALIFKKRT